MGSTLTGNKVKTTYDSLLKLTDNDNLTGSKKTVTDGLGNDTPLSLSSTEVASSVQVEATGFKTPSGTSTQFLMADGSVSAGGSIADAHYEHTQGVASALWNISHGMGKYPSVTVVDSGNNVVIGDVEHVTNNTIRIHFAAAFSGTAYLN